MDFGLVVTSKLLFIYQHTDLFKHAVNIGRNVFLHCAFFCIDIEDVCLQTVQSFVLHPIALHEIYHFIWFNSDFCNSRPLSIV